MNIFKIENKIGYTFLANFAGFQELKNILVNIGNVIQAITPIDKTEIAQ